MSEKMIENMKEIELTELLYDNIKRYHRSIENAKGSNQKIEYIIDNSFLKDKFLDEEHLKKIKKSPKYKYVPKLIKIFNEMKSNFKDLNERNFGNEHHYIRRLIYKEEKEPKIKSEFDLFTELAEDEKLYLIEYSFCTKGDITDFDISKKLEELSFEDVKRNEKKRIKIYEINNLNDVYLNKNEKSFGRKVYEYMIASNNYNSVSVETPKKIPVETPKKISDSFSLICFRRLFKTLKDNDKSLFERQFESFKKNKPNDLKNYYNMIYDREHGKFNRIFKCSLNFYNFQEVVNNNYNGENENKLSATEFSEILFDLNNISFEENNGYERISDLSSPIPSLNNEETKITYNYLPSPVPISEFNLNNEEMSEYNDFNKLPGTEELSLDSPGLDSPDLYSSGLDGPDLL
ncbi:hypothetical protein BCR32DRAFT_308404 [Anaeromyces robustus]|uniref:Uncharacterized protein n=1 Tax=Anaeromyces robustus TaxID=1754192 RepID=A0A1Y1V5G5_9FUNG|nr:hypothetical protein BCR32DRAFT_308404 [Anaeromyces robustus]|eukprot:ORX47673.1 hypothetical protein BCR32DRAFT_308404 [Anaeromyces robustus]